MLSSWCRGPRLSRPLPGEWSRLELLDIRPLICCCLRVKRAADSRSAARSAAADSRSRSRALWAGQDSNLRPTDYESCEILSRAFDLARGVRSSSILSGEFAG